MFRKKGPSEVEIAQENEVKIGITQEFAQALKTVQKENIGTADQAVYSTDTANSVCNCLEAVFLHGLKSKALNKIASYVGVGQQATVQTNLNFWGLVSRITHSEVIAQLKHLGQITTEVGLCRAWVRVALNDGIMESYIDAIVADVKTLEYYYQRTAYLRDSEQPEIMKSYLQGLMHFQFKLSYNASVLNEWAYPPLLLAGVIDSKDAPPPIIKHPVTQPVEAQPKTSSSHQNLEPVDPDPNNSVEVRKIRSRSRGNNDTDSKGLSKSSRSKDNPMEQPRFGSPRSSYYVTSSEFTSRDVEEFKKLSSKASSKAKSECSTSSHVSCPDPPHMNLSPADYVRKMYKSSEGSPGSEKTFWSQESGNRFNGSEKNYESLENKAESTEHLSALDYDSSYGGDTENEGKEKERTKTKELEESWEEFYKSPVQKQKETFDKRKFQRLDSFNREMKEKSILHSYDDTLADKSEHNGNESLKTFESHSKMKVKAIVKTTEDVKENEDEIDWASALNESKQIGSDTNTKKYEVTIQSQVEKVDTGEIDDLLNISQKLLNELGIEDVEESVELVKDEIETSDKKSLEEKDAHAQETVTDSKPNIDISQPILIEEKVKIESDDDNERIGGRTTASPKKKKKGKSRSSLEKLKPQLSLSPPNSEALPPELSDATADKVDRIETDGKSEYFAKHRLSLPAVSPMHDKSRSAKRKSLPNVLEKPSSSPHTIEDYLYGTGPLEEEDEVVDGDGTAIGNGNKSEDDVIDPEEDELKRREAGMDPRQSVGNNLMFSGRGWSSSIGSEGTDTFDAASPPRSSAAMNINNRPKSESFGTLLQNYTPASSLSTKSIDDVLATLPERRTTIISPVVSSPNEVDTGIEGFEVVEGYNDPDPNELSRMCQFSEIANEKGLDAQNFQCKGCSRSIGLIFGKPRTCKFDGWYYCYECHENDEYYIPALIVHNWDFRKQKVCKKNFEYLQDKEEQPYINVEDINPRLYEHVPEMLEIQNLRVQLMHLKTYLFTCKQSIAEDFRKLIWPRDYLYEGRELYSLADLLQVPTGSLASSLRKVIKFATKHVYSCRLCSQKGFICELCNNPKVIYAFEMDATFRCPQCKTVFHKACKTDNRPCPKCQRRQHRQSLHGSNKPLLTPDYDSHVDQV
ncbi:uncharacterized protein LOC128246875 isoform X2 [Mya arenaria]|uniref:uncharacterized protein LOC128246875 isoform X2 n=1 Tax=Mya arenaria TaxID=6604 RepID=UPI0022E55DB1|nr:uncharacterized protein LOC128246875 isoform X2 [Mya arenaria]